MLQSSWPVGLIRSIAAWRRGSQTQTHRRSASSCDLDDEEARLNNAVTTLLKPMRVLTKKFHADLDQVAPMPHPDPASIACTETAPVGEVCLISENPYRILRVAERGNINEFHRMVHADPSLLRRKDDQGKEAVHCAASKNQLAIIEYIITHGGDVNCKDNNGETPLHAAVRGQALEAIKYLLQNNADPSIMNKRCQAPVHLAVELNFPETLSVLLKDQPSVSLSQGGEHGRTALHLAAIYDHAECAQIILEEKGCVKTPCHNGYYAIHEAAKNASERTLEVILRYGESRGYSRAAQMKFYDMEGNDALHSAVHSGDIKAVKMCLESGALISSQQHDLSTPVHLACSQGALKMIRLMFSLQPDEKYKCLNMADINQMTPLHCAALFDHADLVEFLVTEGSDINALDRRRRSPLLVAAARGAWNAVEVLLRLGVDTMGSDCDHRTVLHFIVMNGGRLEQLEPYLQTLGGLLDDKDSLGCTPLHYASRKGHCRSIESLIRLGARVNLKNNDNQSPLHFAARYGRYNTAVKLLESEKGPSIINATDGDGATSLHIASENGHTRVVQLLLARGALLHRDHNGRTPLHLAAMNGSIDTMDLLLSFHSHLLDQTDKDGNTALHLAATNNKVDAVSYLLSAGCQISFNTKGGSPLDFALQEKSQETALAMVTHSTRGVEFLEGKSQWYGCYVRALIIYMPEVFMSVLDSAITHSAHKKDSKDYSITYNFNSLSCAKERTERDRKLRPPPLIALNTMVQHGRVDLLAHPICQKYLQMKWRAYGMQFHLANLFVYFIFLVLLTVYVSELMMCLGSKLTDVNIDMQPVSLEHSTLQYVISVFVVTFSAFNIMKELFQFYQQKVRYLYDIINLLEWVLYITAVLTVWPTLTGHLRGINLSCAAVAIFLTWFNFLIYLQRFDMVGIYVVMFLEILNTLVRVLLLFSILIIAFGLAFHILLLGGNHMAFATPPMAFMRIFSMMVGEIDFVNIFVNPTYSGRSQQPYRGNSTRDCDVSTTTTTLPFPRTSHFLFVAFMVLMPILLMNLLIGLAVGDIEAVRHNAKLKRLAKQVELHSELERKLPWFVVQNGFKKEIIEYPNATKCEDSKWVNFFRRFLHVFMQLKPVVVEDRSIDDDVVYEEMLKHESRLKDISAAMERQHQLLRLIIQKMEIRTEADDFDEGVREQNSVNGPRVWHSPNLRRLRSGARSSANLNSEENRLL